MAESLKYLADAIPDKLGRVPVSSELAIDQSQSLSVRGRIAHAHTRGRERETETERGLSHAPLDDKSLPIESKHADTHDPIKTFMINPIDRINHLDLKPREREREREREFG